MVEQELTRCIGVSIIHQSDRRGRPTHLDEDNEGEADTALAELIAARSIVILTVEL